MPKARAIGLVVLLVGGGLGVVLAGVESDLFDLERHLVPKELALHLTALGGMALFLPGRRTLRLGIVDLLLVAALLWAAVSALLASNHWLAFRSLGVSASGLVVYAMARVATGAGLGRAVLVGLLVASLLAALLGLAQVYGLDGLDWPALSSERPPGGSFGNRNFLAHFEVIALAALLLVAAEARARGGKLCSASAVALTTAIVVLTRSRAAWLAGLASVGGATVMILLRARAWRARTGTASLARVGAAVALGAAAAVLLPNRLTWRSETPYRESLQDLVNYREGSGRGRLVQYRNSLALVGEDPVFGVGPGNWFVHYPRVTTPGDPSFAGYDPIPTNPWPSSDWVAFLTERGTVGAVLLLLAGGAALLVAWRRAGTGALEVEGRSVALTAVLLAAFVAGLFDAVVLLPAPVFLVAALVGVLLPDTRPLIDRELGGGRSGAVLLAPAIGIATLAFSSAGQLVAIRMTRRDAPREVVERAVRFDPGNHRLHLRLAQWGPCSARLPHVGAAQDLLPHHPYPRRMAAGCKP